MPPPIDTVRRLLLLRRARQILLIEALARIVWARTVLCFCPSSRIAKYLNRGSMRASSVSQDERKNVRCSVKWAVERCSRVLPGSTSCLARAIAGQAMCRKRGVNAILYYGAARAPMEGVIAHAWLLDDMDGILGHEIATDYTILARFPK